MIKNRDPFWDFLKGVFILAVLFIHAKGGWNFIAGDFYMSVDSLSFNSWFWGRILTGAVIPVFFFISGYLISEKISISVYYQKRFKRIVVPFFIWSGVYTLVNMFFYNQCVTFLSFLLGTNGIQLYFLVVLIQFTILTPLLTAVSNKKLMLAICIAITFINNVYQLNYWLDYKKILPNEMILGTCFIAYYYLGYYFRTSVDIEKLNTKKIRTAAVAILLVAFALLLKSSYWLLEYTAQAPVATSYNNPLNIIYSISIMFCLMAFKNAYTSGAVKRKIEWIGIMSIDFFAVHWLFMPPMLILVQGVDPERYMWPVNIGMIIGTFLCSYIIIQIKQKVLSASEVI